MTIQGSFKTAWAAALAAAALLGSASAGSCRSATSSEQAKAQSGRFVGEISGGAARNGETPAVSGRSSSGRGSAMGALLAGAPSSARPLDGAAVPAPAARGIAKAPGKILTRENVAEAGLAYCLLAIGLLTDLLGGPATWPAAALIAVHAAGAAACIRAILKPRKNADV